MWSRVLRDLRQSRPRAAVSLSQDTSHTTDQSAEAWAHIISALSVVTLTVSPCMTPLCSVYTLFYPQLGFLIFDIDAVITQYLEKAF